MLAEKSSAPLTFFKHIAEYLYFTHMFVTLLGKKKTKTKAGAYILENTPPPWGGEKYQPMSFGGKNMKRRKENGGKSKRKRKKVGRKRKKGERK
jgi:hypothetical protein